MNEVTVRRAREEDVPQLAAWNAQLVRDERNDNGLTADDIAPRLRDWMGQGFVACVIAVDGAPCGYAIYRDTVEWVHLRHFFIDAAYRRRGCGRRAFAALRAGFPAGKRILVEVLVWNEAGAAFWKAVGFRERYLGLQMTPDAA